MVRVNDHIRAFGDGTPARDRYRWSLHTPHPAPNVHAVGGLPLPTDLYSDGGHHAFPERDLMARAC